MSIYIFFLSKKISQHKRLCCCRPFPSFVRHQKTFLMNLSPERCKRESRDLKELLSERNAHDSHAEQASEEEVADCELKS